MNNADPKERPGLAAGRGTKPDVGQKLRIFAFIVFAALIIGFLVVRHMENVYQVDLARATLNKASAPPLVDVVTAKKAPPFFSLTLPGETGGWYESTIYARVDGYVADWKFDIGDHVKKGQVLMTIETPDLDARLAAAQAKVKADQALVVARQANADFQKTTYTRWKNSPKGVVSEQERDAKKEASEYAIAQIDQAKSQVTLDQALVARYIALTQFKEVVAPYDGIITKRHVDIGDLVSAGNVNTTALYHIVEDNVIRVFSYLPQKDAIDIKDGAPARITVEGMPDRVFDGKVTRTADAIDPKTRTLQVEVDIPNPDHALAPGMYVNVGFQVPAEGRVQVPAAAVIFRNAGPVVALVNREGRVEFRRVKITRDDGAIVDIGSSVSPGDRVALNLSDQIKQGDTVQANESVEAAAQAEQSDN